jgi:hypothetical protein
MDNNLQSEENDSLSTPFVKEIISIFSGNSISETEEEFQKKLRTIVSSNKLTCDSSKVATTACNSFNYLNYLTIYDYPSKIRLGNKNDGGYVIGVLDGDYDYYISAGVSNEESFSRDFIKMFNMNKKNSAAFDGTIDRYPYEYTKDITFYKRNISTNKDINNANLSYFMDNYTNIFLKMDIEGAEYPWLISLNEEQLNKFKQIVIELHGINDNTWNTTHTDKIECLKKIANSHYAIHIHGNNYGSITNNIPDVIEVTYIRKDIFIKKPNLNTTQLPIQYLDNPNNPKKKDYDIDFSPFVN